MNFEDFESSLERFLREVGETNQAEQVALTEAFGRVLAQNVVASENLPLQKTSSMDGYAFVSLAKNETQDGCGCCDTNTHTPTHATPNLTTKKTELRCIGVSAAGGYDPNLAVKKGECVKTFTGALLPAGADTVVPVENVETNGECVTITKDVPRGFAVREVGECYKKGEVVLRSGVRLGFGELGVLAEMGKAFVEVRAKRRVGILATGNELLGFGEARKNPSQIYPSSTIMLFWLVRAWGGEAVILPVLKDECESVKEQILASLKSVDILVTTGGVSVGDFDFVKEVARSGEVLVDGASIKPGRHVKIARFGEKLLFALPGFPLSSVITATLYLKPLLRGAFEEKFSAVLAEDYAKKSGFCEFVPSVLSNENGVLSVKRAGKKGSSAVIDGLVKDAVVFVARRELKKGDLVECFKFV